MRKLVVAAAGLATLLVSAPAFADGVYIEFGSGPRYYDDPPTPRYYRHGPRYAYDDDGDDYYRPRYARQVCWDQPYQKKSHHHYITKYRTVCRDH